VPPHRSRLLLLACCCNPKHSQGIDERESLPQTKRCCCCCCWTCTQTHLP
jgi:hypothetical protein